MKTMKQAKSFTQKTLKDPQKRKKRRSVDVMVAKAQKKKEEFIQCARHPSFTRVRNQKGGAQDQSFGKN